MVRASLAHIEKLRSAVDRPNAARNEELWNYVAAVILSRAHRCGRAPKWFAGENNEWAPNRDGDVWCEGIPIGPRRGVRGRSEGDSRIDISWGAITNRPGKDAGIAFSPEDGDRVTFVEAKLLSDLGTNVSHDPVRNQMARVIESLLCFQDGHDGHARPREVRFALLTPKQFIEEYPRARLYGYKFDDYRNNGDALLADINTCAIAPRNIGHWHYPEDIADRIKRRTLEWWSYEDILLCDEGFSAIGEERNLLQWASEGMPQRALTRIRELLAPEEGDRLR